MTSNLPEFSWLSCFNNKLPPTPFYLYSEERLEQLWKQYNAGLKNSDIPIKLHFPIKANNNPHLLSFFKQKECGVDVVSGDELEFCLKQGFKGEDIIFSSSGKSNQELELAVYHEIKMICIESSSEFKRLKAITKKAGKKARICFRVNPNVDAETHPYISTGLYDHKFGIDFDEAFDLYKKAKQSDNLEVVGISTHIGSQIMKISIFEETLQQLLSFTTKLKKENISLKILDIGGGLGIDYKNPQKNPPFKEYSKFLSKAAHEWKKISGKKAHVISECGRALCAHAGIIVSEIIAIKKTPFKNFAIVDASMTELIRPSLYQSEHIFEEVTPTKGNKNIEWQIAGSVCETTDVLLNSYYSGELKEGDLFLIHQAGAYGYVMASHYNLRPMPAEWWITKENKAVESRKTKSFL